LRVLRHAGDATDTRRRWFVLVVLCVGQLMIVLDSTVVNVALPVIQHDLHFSQTSLAWVVNAYLLTFGGLLLLAGRLGDLVGRARIFLLGLGAFIGSSLLCGLAPTAGMLVAARFVQGASAAMIASMVLGIISPMFTEHRERTLAFSVFASVTITGMALGLLLGGILTELVNWHWIFFINVPVGACCLVVGIRIIPVDVGLGVRAGADVLGAVLVTLAPMSVVYGIINAGTSGWSSAMTVGPFAASAVFAGAFVAVESRSPTPLIPLRTFRYRSLVCATVVRTLIAMGGFGVLFLGALYLEHVLGYGPLKTGLAFLPVSILTGIISLGVIPRVVGKVDLRFLCVAGLVFITLSLLGFARTTDHSSYTGGLLLPMILFGVGNGLFFMPSITIAMSDVAPTESGVASGLTNVAVQLGGSIGVAAIATVATAHTNVLLAQHDPLRAALTAGYRTAWVVSAAFTTLSLVAAIFLLPPSRKGELAEIAVEGSAPLQ
jgi:EmrB/QacA subfamily drug resistance transporter